MLPKFVQIIVSGAGRYNGPHLYGLTAEGEVWYWAGFNGDGGGWFKCDKMGSKS